MRTARQGDRVRVHFVKRTQAGAVSSSRGKPPLELTVGAEHRRLPGLGLALVGLGEGERVKVVVPPERAYGLPRPDRVRRLLRSRFPQEQALAAGNWVRATGRTGRRLLVRVVEVRDDLVVVDANHPWAGQAVVMEVELVSIQPADGGEKLPALGHGPETTPGPAQGAAPGAPPYPGRS
jgi:peptidylprolyl isomerase